VLVAVVVSLGSAGAYFKRERLLRSPIIIVISILTTLFSPPHTPLTTTKATMGLTFSRIWERMFGKKEMRILMVGLDAAGKTTILYKLKLGEVVTTIPTIGYVHTLVDTKRLSEREG